mmetsp:Transcript_92432/g.298770  ORF Transcript_92432/g.298770 Transcript_92432/m.298770 type:complete len:264 (-) Transcript_92432:19-810(-)
MDTASWKFGLNSLPTATILATPTFFQVPIILVNKSSNLSAIAFSPSPSSFMFCLHKAYSSAMGSNSLMTGIAAMPRAVASSERVRLRKFLTSNVSLSKLACLSAMRFFKSSSSPCNWVAAIEGGAASSGAASAGASSPSAQRRTEHLAEGLLRVFSRRLKATMATATAARPPTEVVAAAGPAAPMPAACALGGWRPEACTKRLVTTAGTKPVVLPPNTVTSATPETASNAAERLLRRRLKIWAMAAAAAAAIAFSARRVKAQN